jgi:G3E family GTPase
MRADVIPVSVVTGFLGSGKTTVLRHLLRQPEFSRSAVIVNEFGEVGLDHELVEASEDSVIELTTGCLCCKVRTDLAETLQDLLRRRDEDACTRFDRVVIETSGLADPAPILQTLMTDAALARRLVLGGVVTTVDAVAGLITLEREWLSQKQIAIADRIVLTKLDLAQAAEPGLRRRVAALNASAPVVRADHGRVDPLLLLGANMHDEQTTPIDVHSWLAKAPPKASHGPHNSGIQSYAVIREEPIPAVALTLFLEALAEHCGPDLLRMKGIVNVLESPGRPMVIHGVQHVFHPPGWLDRWPSGDRRSRIMFITRDIPQAWIELLLDAIGAEVADVALSA